MGESSAQERQSVRLLSRAAGAQGLLPLASRCPQAVLSPGSLRPYWESVLCPEVSGPCRPCGQVSWRSRSLGPSSSSHFPTGCRGPGLWPAPQRLWQCPCGAVLPQPLCCTGLPGLAAGRSPLPSCPHAHHPGRPAGHVLKYLLTLRVD